LQGHKDIFNRFLNGEQLALKTLLDEYHNYLTVVGLRYLRDKPRVQDVIHDVMADLWNSKKEIEISTSVKSFLRGAVINKCLAVIRKESREDLVEHHSYDLSDDAPSQLHQMEADELQLKIEQIISGLPDKCREVFTMCRLKGKSHQEVSDALGISKKTIENHMTKALKALRTGLSDAEILSFYIIFQIYGNWIGESMILCNTI